MTKAILSRIEATAAKHERELQKLITQYFISGNQELTLPQAIKKLDLLEAENFKAPSPAKYATTRMMAALVSSWIDSVFLRTVSLKQAEKSLEAKK